MLLSGIQKLTLLDYPGKVACTVFTGGCNFRCPFCHNASLVLAPESALTEAELFALLEKRRGVLDGVCVTGGEPLLQPDLAELLARIKALGYPVKLDTNGSFPSRLKSLVAAGLVDYVAMDLKSAPDRYAAAVGLPGFDPAPVRESAAFLCAGTVGYEFRTTCVKGLHTPDDLAEIARWIAGAPRYYLQQFVDSGDLLRGGAPFSPAEMAGLLRAVQPFVPAAALRGL